MTAIQKKYKLAFEYDGCQHRESIKFFNGGVKRFKKQQQRDVLKNKLCKEKGIKLLRIPDFANKTEGGLTGWILKELKNLNVKIKKDPKKISFEGLIKNSSVIKELNKIAESRGGKLISKVYDNSYGKLIWECKEGHRWGAMANNVKKKSWCPKCSGTEKGTIEEMRKIAQARGGRCLSSKYKNSTKRLLWECEEGHQWKAVPHNVKTKSWCPICAIKKRGETFKRNAKFRATKK